MPLIEFTDKGLYCEKGGFFIDPWRPVDKAVITHAHADHSRWGMKKYLAHHLSIPVMKLRLGKINTTGMNYGECKRVNGVQLSLHPAGHILGSAQVKVEYKGEIWVISGDYKLIDDKISTPFEPVKCHTLVTESTFGLPVYKWKPQAEVFAEMNQWWRENKEKGLASVILGYSLGKAQRILCSIDSSIGNILLHGAIHNSNLALRECGLQFPKTELITKTTEKEKYRGSLIIAPPSAFGSAWMNKLKPYKVATASGWMTIRGARRRRNVDRGFILSDHADWDELNQAVKLSKAERVYVTHGYTGIFSNWLREQGYDAHPVTTEYEGELSEIGEGASREKESE
ncbi:MAG: ligase-associated DNA damage response exonuclease [Flavobacteriales bacterium]|nr:ligase-associated DNA damage response exonuclease [Flavobacteriales bacterium]